MRYVIVDEERGTCLECGEPLVYGRTDRKFCCDKCKNRYHNRRIRNSRNMKLRVWNALEKNHGILESLIKMDVDAIKLPDLSSLGFNMEYSTSFHKVGRHSQFRCFDILYYMTDSKIFGIRKVAAFISELGNVANDA